MKLPGRPWTLCALATLGVVTNLLGCSDAHGFLVAPAVEFLSKEEDPTAYSATIDAATALPVPEGMHFDWGPTIAAQAFSAAFGNSSYSSLREFVMQHQKMQPSTAISPECGRTKEDASVLQALPEEVVWQHGNNEGFTLSHEGPCEVWCDNERVFVETNCAKTYPQVPAKLPFERAKCLGKTRLQMVWLALHEYPRWQVYMNCAPLAGADAKPSGLSLVPGLFKTTVSPHPAMKTWSASGSDSSSSDDLLLTRPRAGVKIVGSPVTQAPNKTHGASQDGSTASDASEAGCVDSKQSISFPNVQLAPFKPYPPLPSYQITRHPRPAMAHPPRRASEIEDEHVSSLYDDEDASGWSEDEDTSEEGGPNREDRQIEGDDKFAAKATGPVPQEIYERARRDFEEKQTRKEKRHAALKKEFGYA